MTHPHAIQAAAEFHHHVEVDDTTQTKARSLACIPSRVEVLTWVVAITAAFVAALIVHAARAHEC
jgi:hypothetical protein